MSHHSWPQYPRPACPASVGRAARAWWLALGCWCAGSVVGQLLHSPAALALCYRYVKGWSVPLPLAVASVASAALFLGILVLPMRDGTRWARSLLTVLAVPLAAGVVWQVGLCLSVWPVGVGALAQAPFGLVTLFVLPGAVSLMYGRDVRSHYRVTE